MSTELHHGSHRSLLDVFQSDDVPRALINAVIVPAARPVESISAAISLATEIGCVLVVLCSREVEADDVARVAADVGGSVVSVDVDAVADVLPVFETGEVVNGSRFSRLSDLSSKRNLALVLSRMAGWEKVLFLDDDIDNVHPRSVYAAAGLLDRYDAVGLENVGYPDNSVVCHVSRAVGFQQDQFVGAGALAIAPARMNSFFPDIYNEDWLFLLGSRNKLQVAITGTMLQREFDPFADPDRARGEELGDCLAEGLYWLLDDGWSIDYADVKHWRLFLRLRMRFIEELLVRLDQDSEANAEKIAALRAAGEICAALAEEPELCDGYVRLWRSDLARWRTFLEGCPYRIGLKKALSELGWNSIARIYTPTSLHEDSLLGFDDGLA